MKITITGPAKSGKSRLMFYLSQILKEKGFKIEIIEDKDHSEKDYSKTMEFGIDEVIQNIKNNGIILIESKIV